MTNRNYYISLYIFSLFISCSLPALGRDYIHIVGSSTVFPFISFVAEEFSKVNRVTTPVVESIGTGVGMKMLCDINTNNSVDRPDIVMSSRRITDSEIYLCQNYGVKNFLEIKIGYDGLVIASVTDTPILNFSFLDLFKILSAVIPDENGKLINNKFHKWSDIMTELSDDKIEIYGPARSSGSYNTLINKILLPICLSNFISYDIKYFKKNKLDERFCKVIRDDGVYIESGSDEGVIIDKVFRNNSVFGIFGFNFLYLNSEKVHANNIAGIEATRENVINGKYPLSRALYIYVNIDNIDKTNQLKEFLKELLSEKTIGNNGYLISQGLIPLNKEEYTAYYNSIKKYL